MRATGQWGNGWVVLMLAALTAGRPAGAQPPPERVVVRGRVLDARTKAPIKAVTVGLRVGDAAGYSNRILPIPGMNATLSEADGSFAFHGIPEGQYRLIVSNAGGYAPYSEPLTVTAGQAPPAEVLLQPYNYLSGKILKPDGAPAANLPAQLLIVGGPNPSYPGVGTDAAGNYRVPFYTTTDTLLRISVRVQGAGLAATELPAKAGTDLSLDIHLKAGAAVSGVVKQKESGAPVEHANVYLQPRIPTPSPSPVPSLPMGGASTGPDGRFTIRDLFPGEYSLRISLPSQSMVNPSTGVPPPVLSGLAYAPVDLRVTEGDPPPALEVFMVPAPVLQGTVYGPDGQPSSEKNFSLMFWRRTPDGLVWTDTAYLPLQENGKFAGVLHTIGEGQLLAAGTAPGWARFTNVKAEPGKRISLEVHLKPVRQILGQVRLKGGGKPAPGVTIVGAPDPKAARASGRYQVRTVSDDEGRFVIENVVPADYLLWALGVAGAGQPTRVSVPDGADVEDVRLEVER